MKKLFCSFLGVLSLDATAAPWTSQIQQCQREGFFKRRVELRYEQTNKPVPCEANFYRDVEHYRIAHVLFRAQRTVGQCEAKFQAYLKKMESWGVTCTAESSAPSVAVAPPEEVTRTPSSVATQVERTVQLPSRIPVAAEFQVGFSQSAVEIGANGQASFASSSLGPQAGAKFLLPSGGGTQFQLQFAIQHLKYTTSSAVDSFDAGQNWYWGSRVGIRQHWTDSFSMEAGLGISRRLFVRRASQTALAADPLMIPQADVTLRYQPAPRWVPELALTASYLFPRTGVYTQVNAGGAGRVELNWNELGLAWPLQLGICLERAWQNTGRSELSSWWLGLQAGIRLGPSAHQENL